jgi:hypothetical protein
MPSFFIKGSSGYILEFEYIYIKRQNDQKTITNYKGKFKKDTLEKLVTTYNGKVKFSITGSHQRALFLIALRMEFKECLKESLVYITEFVIGLGGNITITLSGYNPTNPILI